MKTVFSKKLDLELKIRSEKNFKIDMEHIKKNHFNIGFKELNKKEQSFISTFYFDPNIEIVAESILKKEIIKEIRAHAREISEWIISPSTPEKYGIFLKNMPPKMWAYILEKTYEPGIYGAQEMLIGILRKHAEWVIVLKKNKDLPEGFYALTAYPFREGRPPQIH